MLRQCEPWIPLASPAAQMRALLAAGLLRNVDNILEIGAHRTPLFRFLQDKGKRVRAINPRAFEIRRSEHQASERLDYRCLELDPFGGAPFALALFGLDLPVTYKLKRYLSEAELVLAEFADTPENRDTFETLAAELGLHRLARVRMDFDEGDVTAYAGPADAAARPGHVVHLVSARVDRPDQLQQKNPFVEPMPELDTSQSRLIDTGFAAATIFPDAAYDFSHGAHGPASYLGGGLLYYTLAYMLCARTCVCLGSGGAFVPRLMRQAQRDIGLGRHGRTVLVDGDRGVYGRPNWLDAESPFRTAYPEIDIRLSDTVEAAAALAGEAVRIDYLHIDADHSREGCLRDFDAYLPLMRRGGLVTLHDTRPEAHDNTTSWQAIAEIRARGFELLNLPMLASGVAIVRV